MSTEAAEVMEIVRQARKGTEVLRLRKARGALLRHGVAASMEHRAVLRDLACRTVVDIGANRGQFSLLCRALFPNCAIHAFEPLPSAAAVFVKVFDNDPLVTLYPFAIGDKAGRATLHISRRDDSSSLLPIGTAQEIEFPGTGETATLGVDVRRLDTLLSPEGIGAPALLKLDVQGSELSALRGCDGLLGRFRWIYCECSFVSLYEGQALAGDVIAWVRQRGFEIAGVYDVVYGRQRLAVQADVLFKRRDGQQP